MEFPVPRVLFTKQSPMFIPSFEEEEIQACGWLRLIFKGCNSEKFFCRYFFVLKSVSV